MREVDCAMVEEKVHQFLDGELSEREADALRHHIADCAHCLDETDLVDTLKKLIKRSCACPPAPAALRLRIVTQIKTVSVTRYEL